RLLADGDGVVFGVMAGMPRGNGWQQVHDSALHAMRIARQLLQELPVKYQDHRRGQYPALSCGISHGGGQRQPSNLYWCSSIEDVLNYLTQSPSFQRLSGFTNSVFQAFAPRLFKHYCVTLERLKKSNPQLMQPFHDSAFAACCFNLGPHTVSRPHRDHANLAWGWCAITALGTFNPTQGGHLILWDLNCAIPIPPGATVMIPSALLEHSNIAILAGEERCSFVQFSAGGLFRWVENELQTEAAWSSKATAQMLELRAAQMQLRWSTGLQMLSRLDEFAPSQSK
ncbi:hypothetical protein BJ912DRAFT_843897, partial [Pholiota molesta]